MSSVVSNSPPSTAHGRAEFTWEIENFSTKTEVQQSPKFSFPANSKVRFMLECSPSIDITGQTEKFVAFNLSLNSSNLSGIRVLLAKPYVRYRIAILGTNGTKYFSQECRNEFTNPNTTRFGVIGGYQIERDYLLDQKNGLLNNDKLIVYCEVDDSCLEKILVIPDNPILDDYRSLLESGKYSDVVLLIDGKSLSVHKNILSARSVVFGAMFEHDLEEKKTNRVEISDVALEVMELMLGYIYTGQIPEMMIMSDYYATELFVAADKYQLNLLRKSCETYLIKHLKSGTAANILMIADMHQSTDLKEASSVYITENVKQVMSTEAWKVLLTKSDLMQELVLKMANKQDILNKKVKTLEYDLKNSQKNQGKGVFSDRCDVFVANKSEDWLVPARNLNESSFERNIAPLLGKLSDLYSRKYIPKNLKKSKKYIISDSELSCQTSVDFLALLDNGKLSDAFLVVGDVELPIHRNILCARSKVFADLFETQTRVQVDNISVEACKQLLRYIYTGQFGLKGDEFASCLLKASHKYQLNHLKAKCEKSLSSSIDVGSVVDIFLLADTNEANHLKRSCFDFICENVKQVIQTDGWKVFKQTQPEFALELFEQVTENKW